MTLSSMPASADGPLDIADGSPDAHWLPADAVLAALESRPDGLSAEEAAARQGRDGPNKLPEAPRPGPLARFIAQFRNILIYVLLVAGGISGLLGEWVDAGVILLVVLINAVVGVVQEGKAERALDAIRAMLSPVAEVRRDGVRITIPAEELARGDIALLKTGDRVPADMRVLSADALEVQEGALTGESLGILKTVEPLPGATELADRTNMVYAGTLVTQGGGTGIVTAIGAKTELGRITGLIERAGDGDTPLMRQLERFAGVLTIAILSLAAAMALYGWLVQGFGIRDMFMAAVALAVAAIPEGLPAIMTVALAVGVTRMARRRAIIRRLPAVETLGAVSVICSDKTGTLTRNELSVAELVTADATEEADRGVHPSALRLARAGVFCNEGEAEWHRDGWRYHGSPTDTAFLTAAVACGLDPGEERAARPRQAALPFDSGRKFMATRNFVQDRPTPSQMIYLKGAPERVFERCDREAHAAGDRPLDPVAWQTRLESLTARGRRVLAVAARETDAGSNDRARGFAPEDVGDGYVLLGLVGLIDPPREEAGEAVARCRAAGITVKMITGDHAATARAVAGALGIGDGKTVLTGPEIDGLDDTALQTRAGTCDVFARTTPEHKIRLVSALRAGGHVVAMTGDGVNDAPALKRADVGTAMGVNGTEAAKESAEMVLADDNFASIAAAVEEGRTVYDNIKKAILFILPTSFGWSFVILAAVLIGGIAPVTPAQILWVNMIATVTLALALSFEPVEQDVMARPPRDPTAPLLTGFLFWRTVFVAGLMVAGSYGLFLWAMGADRPVEEARTLAVTALVVADCAYLLNARRLSAGLFARGLLTGNPYILPAIGATLALQGCFVYAPPLQALFATAGLTGLDWGLCAAAALIIVLAVEIERAAFRRLARKSESR
jgi:calcium-translocating P-type ATPase